ncbi:hypothetical protein HDV63DRAFT_367635, partial [Trichoderma sp. SZMC 28014]
MTSTFDTWYTPSTPAFSDLFFPCPCYSFPTHSPLTVASPCPCYHSHGERAKKKGEWMDQHLGQEDGVTWEGGGGIHLDASLGKKGMGTTAFPPGHAGWEQSFGFFRDMESDSWFRCVGEPASFHHGTDGQHSTRIFIKKIEKQKN